MIWMPPKCSRKWTDEERIMLVAWMVNISMDRVERDDPAMPMIAKSPAYELFRAMKLVLEQPPDVLEENREALEKPYDPSLDYHGVLIVESSP